MRYDTWSISYRAVFSINIRKNCTQVNNYFWWTGTGQSKWRNVTVIFTWIQYVLPTPLGCNLNLQESLDIRSNSPPGSSTNLKNLTFFVVAVFHHKTKEQKADISYSARNALSTSLHICLPQGNSTQSLTTFSHDLTCEPWVSFTVDKVSWCYKNVDIIWHQ